jgi:hypothetical protein
VRRRKRTARLAEKRDTEELRRLAGVLKQGQLARLRRQMKRGRS